MNQRLIRFDVRLLQEDYVDLVWSAERRETFLLRSEIDWPLSVDQAVWPSVFFSKIFRDFTSFPSGNIEVDPETDGGDCWLNLQQMTEYFETHRQSNQLGVFIAIHLLSEQDISDDMVSYSMQGGIQCGMPLGRTTPSALPGRSELLGYDVADAAWISGLSNCGYDDEEKHRLQSLWAPQLNSFGLLKTLESATEFRDICDKRVVEHAPFWVFGISRLPIAGSI